MLLKSGWEEDNLEVLSSVNQNRREIVVIIQCVTIQIEAAPGSNSILLNSWNQRVLLKSKVVLSEDWRYYKPLLQLKIMWILGLNQTNWNANENMQTSHLFWNGSTSSVAQSTMPVALCVNHRRMVGYCNQNTIQKPCFN